jgi:hypothetical protein
VFKTSIIKMESEEHFLLQCPAYDLCRREVFDIAMVFPGFAGADTGGQLATLLSKSELYKAVATYCKSALKIRNNQTN